MYIANIIVLLSLQQHAINNSSKKLICHCITSPQWRGLTLSQEVESTSLVLFNTGDMLQAVYNIKWIYQRAPQHATKMYGMCVSNEGKLQAAVNCIHSSSNHCDGVYYPCMDVFKGAGLSLANWGSLNGVRYPCTHVCLWPRLAFDQTNDRRATPQTITSHISETRGIHSPSPQDTFLLGTSLWQRQ